jgi:enediyne polyketide synthase
MAEAASALAGRPMRRLTDVRMEAPVAVPASADAEPAVIRICALRDGDCVTAVIRCAESGFATEHFRATFHEVDDPMGAATGSLAASLPDLDEMPASDAGIVDGTELYGPTCFQSGRFRRAALLPEVTSRSCRALVRGGDGEPWFGDAAEGGEASLVLGSPGLNDATWHVLQACVPHRRVLPAGCESVTFSGRTADGAVEIGAVEIRAAAVQAGPGDTADGKPGGRVPGGGVSRRSVPEPRRAAPAVVVPAQGGAPDAVRASAPPTEYVWDVEAVDSAGRVLVTWRGLRLADAGPLPRAAAWPASLLSAYLEHSAVALGLNSELRVSVHSGQADIASGLVPRPSPAPDHEPAAGEPSHARSARGTGQLEGFVLSVRAPEATACAWEVAAPDADFEPGLAELETELRPALAELGEPPNTAAALLTAVAACLVMAGAPGAGLVPADGTVLDGWLALRVGRAVLAGTVVQISGVSCPVAIAVLTGDAAPGEEREEEPGKEREEEPGKEREEEPGKEREEEPGKERDEERRAGPGKRQRRAGGTKAATRKAGARRQNAATATRRTQPGSPPG